MNDSAVCSCGGEWWQLIADPESGSPARVTLDDRGIVIGFSGRPVCESCGQPWEPRPTLRLVE